MVILKELLKFYNDMSSEMDFHISFSHMGGEWNEQRSKVKIWPIRGVVS